MTVVESAFSGGRFVGEAETAIRPLGVIAPRPGVQTFLNREAFDDEKTREGTTTQGGSDKPEEKKVSKE